MSRSSDEFIYVLYSHLFEVDASTSYGSSFIFLGRRRRSSSNSSDPAHLRSHQAYLCLHGELLLRIPMTAVSIRRRSRLYESVDAMAEAQCTRTRPYFALQCRRRRLRLRRLRSVA